MKAPSRFKGRSGRVKPTLLLWLVVFAAVGYYGFEIGGVYWRQYRVEDTVSRDLSSAGQVADETIRQRVLGHIADMNLPLTAGSGRFVRTDAPRALRVSVSYVETVNLLFTEKRIPISLNFERPF